MAADVLTNDLELDLYRIDLSSVVTSASAKRKRICEAFDVAKGGAILLFDEADTLFGKRTKVKDSHDRHANIEVIYLLQRLEAYCGLGMLTTSMRSAIDSAFLRRLRFVIILPFPDPVPSAMMIALYDYSKSVCLHRSNTPASTAAHRSADARPGVHQRLQFR